MSTCNQLCLESLGSWLIAGYMLTYMYNNITNAIGCKIGRVGNQKPMLGNWYDLFMYFLTRVQVDQLQQVVGMDKFPPSVQSSGCGRPWVSQPYMYKREVQGTGGQYGFDCHWWLRILTCLNYTLFIAHWAEIVHIIENFVNNLLGCSTFRRWHGWAIWICGFSKKLCSKGIIP
jgi:hypothetical protein